MINPYESPTEKNQVQSSLRYVWQRQLICPVCAGHSTFVGRVCFLHPQFRIRCQSCGVRARLRFKRSDCLRIQATWIFAVGFAVTLMVLMLNDDPFQKAEEFLRRVTPGLIQHIEAGGYQDLIPPGIALLLLLIAVKATFDSVGPCNGHDRSSEQPHGSQPRSDTPTCVTI